MSGEPALRPPGRDRDAWGCIVSFENSDGKTLSLHRTGRDALARCCDAALALDETFRVISVSTPETIYTDLVGRLGHPLTNAVALPEHPRLARIRRMSMIHPRIAPMSANALRKVRSRGDSWETG